MRLVVRPELLECTESVLDAEVGVDGAEPVQAGALVVFAELGLLQVVRPATRRLQDILNIDINISY